MQFQVQHSSEWIGLAVILVGCAIAGVILYTDKFKNGDTSTRRLIAILFILVLSGGSGLWLVNQDSAQNNASFSKQLMDEYHATSSRSFSSIDYDLRRSSGPTAVFNRDGKDTLVFIRLVTRDGDKSTITFTTIDGNSLYPKSSK